MIVLSWIPLPSPEVMCRLTDDGAVLISPEAGDLRVLNAVGAMIWQMLNGQRTVGDLEAELVRRYQIPAAQAHADLEQFLSDLHRRGLLSWRDAGTPGPAS
jgi:hypothetical protein